MKRAMPPRPRRIARHAARWDEIEVVVALGRVVSRTHKMRQTLEVWWVGACDDVVLNVETRRRLDAPCPDCVPPPPGLPVDTLASMTSATPTTVTIDLSWNTSNGA